MENDLEWKMALHGKWPCMENGLAWKMALNGTHLDGGWPFLVGDFV